MILKAVHKVVFGVVLFSVVANADTINLGIFSFDSVQPGLVAFSITGLTGDPGQGGFALPPDFPVYSAVNFLASSITVYQGASSELIFLGDLFPGTYSSPALQFPEGAPISSAVFTATLNSGSLMLSDGSVVQVSTDIVIALGPSVGAFLGGGDLVLLGAAAGGVPEPGCFASSCIGLLLLGGFRLARSFTGRVGG